MLKDLLGKISISKKVKALPIDKRSVPNLILGNTYYTSFGGNDAYPCTLLEVLNEFEMTQIRVEILSKPKSKKGFIDLNGNLSHHWSDKYILYAFEIGTTPEEAVKNTIT